MRSLIIVLVLAGVANAKAFDAQPFRDATMKKLEARTRGACAIRAVDTTKHPIFDGIPTYRNQHLLVDSQGVFGGKVGWAGTVGTAAIGTTLRIDIHLYEKYRGLGLYERALAELREQNPDAERIPLLIGHTNMAVFKKGAFGTQSYEEAVDALPTARRLERMRFYTYATAGFRAIPGLRARAKVGVDRVRMLHLDPYVQRYLGGLTLADVLVAGEPLSTQLIVRLRDRSLVEVTKDGRLLAADEASLSIPGFVVPNYDAQ